jgi:hypothetical protein
MLGSLCFPLPRFYLALCTVQCQIPHSSKPPVTTTPHDHPAIPQREDPGFPSVPRSQLIPFSMPQNKVLSTLPICCPSIHAIPPSSPPCIFNSPVATIETALVNYVPINYRDKPQTSLSQLTLWHQHRLVGFAAKNRVTLPREV